MLHPVTFTKKEQKELEELTESYSQATTIKKRDDVVESIDLWRKKVSDKYDDTIRIIITPPASMAYLITVLNWVETEKPITGELGAWKGDSTKIITGWIKTQVGGKHVVIDWFNGSEGVLEGGFKELFLDNTKHCEYEYLDMESGDAAQEVPDGTFDFFFIDADHRYHMVKRDIELWYPKVKSGGIFAGHDYDSEEYDDRYIEVDAHDDIHHGVTKAVNERFGIPYNNEHMWWIRKE